MTDTKPYEKFTLGSTWIIYATLSDAAGAPLPTMDEAVKVEWRFGRTGRIGGSIYPTRTLSTDEFSTAIGGIQRISAGKVKIVAGPEFQDRLDTDSSYVHQVWVHLPGGESYAVIEGTLRLRPRL